MRAAIAGGHSRRPHSNQPGVHPRLAERVARHRHHRSRRPVAACARRAFDEVAAWRAARSPAPLILDAGCGVGDSSRALARHHPGADVLGVDKSAHRLARERDPGPRNLLLLRADLIDLYPLMAAAGWRVARQYLLYPNPWPKAAHLGRRWHGSAVFPALLALGGRLELRTNWAIYAQEWQLALGLCGRAARLRALPGGGEPLSPFEAKYRASGHTLWQVLA